ncbi:MAG: response regulator [Gammaproteobacteria bacterium]|nr:response regulator [Gammaproteobacteria bacterium]
MSNTLDVLLAHPNPATREFIEARLLEDEFARVVAVETGREAIDRLQRASFHAMVTAARLEDVDCWRLARMIRSGRFCASSLPILAILDQSIGQPLSVLGVEHTVVLIHVSELDGLPHRLADCVHSQARPTVLIIEDDEGAARAAELALRKNFAVEVHHDGQRGLEAWMARKHDIILLDVMLPNLSGPDVLRAIIAKDPRQPVVIITAYATPTRHQDLMIDGAIDFVEKPFNVNALHQVCEAALLRSGLIVSAAEAEKASLIMDEVTTRVQVADEHLSTGRAAAASFQLKNALAVSQRTRLTEEQWAQLMGEFPSGS